MLIIIHITDLTCLGQVTISCYFYFQGEVGYIYVMKDKEDGRYLVEFSSDRTPPHDFQLLTQVKVRGKTAQKEAQDFCTMLLKPRLHPSERGPNWFDNMENTTDDQVIHGVRKAVRGHIVR